VWGISALAHSRVSCPGSRSDATLCPLCFHGLTNCFSRKPFPFTIICVAPRVSPNAAKSAEMKPQPNQ
jgi:hypothetical protein